MEEEQGYFNKRCCRMILPKRKIVTELLDQKDQEIQEEIQDNQHKTLLTCQQMITLIDSISENLIIEKSRQAVTKMKQQIYDQHTFDNFLNIFYVMVEQNYIHELKEFYKNLEEQICLKVYLIQNIKLEQALMEIIVVMDQLTQKQIILFAFTDIPKVSEQFLEDIVKFFNDQQYEEICQKVFLVIPCIGSSLIKNNSYDLTFNLQNSINTSQNLIDFYNSDTLFKDFMIDFIFGIHMVPIISTQILRFLIRSQDQYKLSFFENIRRIKILFVAFFNNMRQKNEFQNISDFFYCKQNDQQTLISQRIYFDKKAKCQQAFRLLLQIYQKCFEIPRQMALEHIIGDDNELKIYLPLDIQESQDIEELQQKADSIANILLQNDNQNKKNFETLIIRDKTFVIPQNNSSTTTFRHSNFEEYAKKLFRASQDSKFNAESKKDQYKYLQKGSQKYKDAIIKQTVLQMFNIQLPYITYILTSFEYQKYCVVFEINIKQIIKDQLTRFIQFQIRDLYKDLTILYPNLCLSDNELIHQYIKPDIIGNIYQKLNNKSGIFMLANNKSIKIQSDTQRLFQICQEHGTHLKIENLYAEFSNEDSNDENHIYSRFLNALNELKILGLIDQPIKTKNVLVRNFFAKTFFQDIQ